MADEYIRFDTTIIAIDNLINEAATGTIARTLFKAKDTIYNQQRYVINGQPIKHGQWIECCNELDKKCSCCDKVHGTIYEKEQFCPNCGARMDLKDGDSE